MADIFADTSPQYFKGEGSDGVTRYTGDEDTDKYLNSLPPEKRAEALKRLTAPLTGEELAEKAKDPNYTMDRGQYSRFIEFKKTEDRGILDDIGMLAEGGMHIFEQIAKTVGSAKDHPLDSLVKLGPSGVEALWQGTRNMYGMVAQSADPTSKFFRFKSAITGEDSDQGYNQYLEARQFNRESIELAEGKRTILVNKDYIDHEMTQAMSYIADPSLFIPFAKIGGLGLRAIGMGERAALLAARAGAIKSRIIGGTLKYMVGKPIEFIGGATRGVIDYGISAGSLATEAVTGLSAREVAQTVRMGSLGTTAASLAGHSAPIISDVSNAYIAGGAAQGLGQALGAIGSQMQRGPRGFVSYAKAALEADKAILSPHAQNLLKLINGVDPLISLTADIAKGSSHGVLIGAGLGYGNAGYEGMWQGAGAGMALGGVGGLAGGMLSRATGAKIIERADITAKYAIEGAKQTGKFHQASSWEFLRKIGELTGTKPMMDGIVAAFDSLAPDSRYIFRNNKEHNTFLDTNGFDRKTGRHKTDPNAVGQISEFHHINMEGVVMQVDKSGQWTMHINTEKLFSQKNGKFRAGTVPHEMLHLILRKAVLTPHFLENLKHDILGVRAANGKLLEGGSVNPEETRQFFREYMKRMYNEVDKTKDPTGHANEAKRLSDLADKAIDEYVKTGTSTFSDSVIGSNRPLLEHLTEEFGAYYFQELVGAKSPDFLYFAGKYEGIRGVMDRVTNRFKDHWERKRSALDPLFSFKEGKSLSEGFRDASGKRIRVGSIDYMISDFLKMTQNQNRTGRVDLTLMSDKARGELILRKGLDDLGRTRGARDPRRKSLSEDTQLGKAIHAELLAINPSRTTDGAGNLVGHLSDADLAGLVRAGHISEAMAQKVKTLQNLANNPDKPVFDTGYWGATHTTEVGPNAQRVTGDEVPYTNRHGILLDVNIKIGKNGKVSMVARTLDLRVNAERANNMWANPAVRDLWNGNADLYKADYVKYLTNMGKDVAGGKIETSLLLDNGDGKGGQRRDIMHQIAGVPLGAGDVYVNHPIGEIHSDALNALTHLSIGRMQDIRLTGEAVLGFDPKNAIPDIGRNFSPSDMAYNQTPNGKIWEHRSGYRFHQLVDGQTVAYDRRGERIGAYSSPEQAMLAGRQKLQAQQKAMHEVAQDVKKAYDRGVHFSPREEHIITRQNDEFYGMGYHLRLRADFIEKIGRLQKMLEDGASRPDTDPRHLRGIERRIALAKELVGKIDRNENLFNQEAIDMLNEAGLPAKTDDVADGGAGQMWMNAQIKKQSYAKDWDAQYPMTFRSALNDRIQQIIKNVPNLTAQRLRKHLLQYGSRTGERLWAEAEAIGFVDWLESKIEPTYILTRRKDANGVLLPRGEEHQPILKQKGVRDSAPLDPNEITEFIKNNGLSIKIDTGSKSRNVSNTEEYVFGGTYNGYNETPIRINESQYHHGVEGHYGPDTIVHTRKTHRFDSEGNKYVYVEEVQSNNAEVKKGAILDGMLNEDQLSTLNRNIAMTRERLAFLDAIKKEYPELEARDYALERLETHHTVLVADALASRKAESHPNGFGALAVDGGSVEWRKNHSSLRRATKEIEGFVKKYPHIFAERIYFEKGFSDPTLTGDALDSQILFGKKGSKADGITVGELKMLLKEHPDLFTIIAEHNISDKAKAKEPLIIKAGGKEYNFSDTFYLERSEYPRRLSILLQRAYSDFGVVISSALGEKLNPQNSMYRKPVNASRWMESSQLRRSLGKTYESYLKEWNKAEAEGTLNYGKYQHNRTNWSLFDAINREFLESGKETEMTKMHTEVVETLLKKRQFVWDRLSEDQRNSYTDMMGNNPSIENMSHASAMHNMSETLLNIDLNDMNTTLQRHILQSKASRGELNGKPLQELHDRARIAFLELAAYSIREGTDNIVLTHPDDAPTVSMMAWNARHGAYGKGIPSVWGGIAAKYGMEVKKYTSTERFLKGIDVASIPEIKQAFDKLSSRSSDTYAKCKVLLDMYEQGKVPKLTEENITYIAHTTSRPIHEVEFPRPRQENWRQQVKTTRDKLAKRVNDGEIPQEFLDAYTEAVIAKEAESKAFERVHSRIAAEQSKAKTGKPMSREELITAMALARGTHFVMNDKFKADVMSGKIMTTFSVAEKDSRGGGRTYDFASDMFRKSFIGRYFNENQETLPKGMSIEIKEYTSQPINKGFNIGIFQGDRGDGKPNRIGGIGVSITGQTAHTSNTGVISEMRGNKLGNVLMSELAERLRSMGVKYLDGVIIDPAQRPYHSRMRTIGNAETIAGSYYDTTRSTLDPTAYYSPNEKKTGRTYTDEQVNTEFVGRFALENPDIASKFLIRLKEAESDEGMGYKLVVYDKDTKKPVARTKWEVLDGEDGGLTDAAMDVEILDPTYKGRKLSQLLMSEQLERSRFFGATSTRSQIVNQEGIIIKNYKKVLGEGKGEITSAHADRFNERGETQYVPATMENFRKEMDLSIANDDGMWKPTVYFRADLDPTAHYSVGENDKGGRTYDKKSLKWKKGFIGRYAAENPEMTKEIKLSFQTEKASQRGSPIMAGRIDGKTTENHYLQITEAGKEVGHITWKTTKGKDGRTMFADPSVSVEPQYRGKNFQHLLYSEAAERARAMGNTDFFQRIENDLGLPLKSQVKTFGENYSKLLDQYTGQYMPPTMENFNKLKYPEIEIHHSDADGNVTKIEKHKGHELWVYAWSKIKSDAWYAISEQDALILRKSEDMPWFKAAIDATNGFVKYATAEDLNSIRGLHAVSHGPDTLSGTDINTVGGERILEGAGGLPYPMLQAERGSPAAWASQGTGFVDIVNSAVKANKDDPRINRREAIMPLVFTTYEKARAAVQGSEAYYKMFEIFRRGKIVSDKDLRLAMLDAVEKIDRKKKTVKDDKGKAIIDETTGEPMKEIVEVKRQTDALRKIVSDNKMNWDEMLAGVMLTLDDGQVQNFGTRAPMADDFMGAVWDRVMKGISDKKKQEVMRFFPEWDASQTKNEFTLANFKMTMGKTISDSLTKGLKSGDVYAIFRFTDFVEPMKSGHRTYDTGIVQKNGQKPQLLLLKKPINVMDLHDIAISEESGQRPISSIPEDTRTNVLGMNNIPYGRTITKGVGQVDFRDIMKNMAVAENFKEQVTPNGKVLQAINGYIIMMQGDKFKVYNGQKVQVGIYASEQEAKKRVLRDNRR